MGNWGKKCKSKLLSGQLHKTLNFPGVQLPTAMVLAAFPYGRTHEIPCFLGGVLIFNK